MANSKYTFAEHITPFRKAMAELFPVIRSPNQKDKRKLPLAVGIRADIEAAFPKVPPTLVQAVLRDYTQGPSYLRTLQAGRPRYGLDGQPKPDDRVTPEQEAHARAALAKIGMGSNAYWKKGRKQPKVEAGLRRKDNKHISNDGGQQPTE